MTEKRDARKLSGEALEELRRLGVSRVLAGEPQPDVARSLQVSRTTVVRWMMAYRAGGSEALTARKSPGRPPTLTEKQRAKLRAIIVGKNPQQLGFGMALWSVRIVSQVIEREFGAVLHDTTVFRLLRSMGLVPRKPTRQAFQRDPDECERWASSVFPDIVRTAKRQQAILAFLDETGVHEDAPIGTTWGEKGTRPVARVTGGRARVNVISTITTRGQLWFRGSAASAGRSPRRGSSSSCATCSTTSAARSTWCSTSTPRTSRPRPVGSSSRSGTGSRCTTCRATRPT